MKLHSNKVQCFLSDLFPTIDKLSEWPKFLRKTMSILVNKTAWNRLLCTMHPVKERISWLTFWLKMAVRSTTWTSTTRLPFFTPAEKAIWKPSRSFLKCTRLTSITLITTGRLLFSTLSNSVKLMSFSIYCKTEPSLTEWTTRAPAWCSLQSGTKSSKS